MREKLPEISIVSSSVDRGDVVGGVLQSEQNCFHTIITEISDTIITGIVRNNDDGMYRNISLAFERVKSERNEGISFDPVHDDYPSTPPHRYRTASRD